MRGNGADEYFAAAVSLLCGESGDDRIREAANSGYG